MPRLLVLFLAALVFAATPADRTAAGSLRINVAWLASDERQGRMTPSPGLDASADYIAAQFRKAGLTPGGQDGTWFQKAAFAQITPKPDQFSLTLESGARRFSLKGSRVTVRSLTALDYQAEAVVHLTPGSPVPSIAGRIVTGNEAYAQGPALHDLQARKPSLIVLAIGGARPEEATPILMDADPALPPVIRVYDKTAEGLLLARGEVKLTVHSAAPERHDVTVRNVAGILRGSDPAARTQFLIVSAHYDHLGLRQAGQGDLVYNGANDNASGVASLFEIARILAALPQHPRRSVLFLAVFGEEEGLLGTAWYVRHPLIPLARTIADINLEQLGRTDSADGPEVARFAFTGPSYSNLSAMMQPAVKAEGLGIYRKDTADDYFDRSDNYEFAQAGIVAHTIVVAFEFADYHAVGDEAGKLDYLNLAAVDRGIAAGVAAVADAANPPKWSDTKAARAYREASANAIRMNAAP